MPISLQTQRWLQRAGYEYLCFISYPRVKREDGSVYHEHSLVECAQRVKRAIFDELVDSIPEPRIFIDSENIPGGTDWETGLRSALCRSLVMVPICAGIYYHPDRPWCGREWAAMDLLGAQRLPAGSELRTIFPLMYRLEKPIPDVVLRTQYEDISRVSLAGRRYYTTPEFRARIKKVVTHIERVAEAIARNEAAAREQCAQFEIPEESAFADWQPAAQAFPFHGSR